jgi:hypothetical protein
MRHSLIVKALIRLSIWRALGLALQAINKNSRKYEGKNDKKSWGCGKDASCRTMGLLSPGVEATGAAFGLARRGEWR